MIIVKLKGGLGNQMFQYAAGLAAATRNNTSLLLDIESYSKSSLANETARKYELEIFSGHFNIAKPYHLSRFIKDKKFFASYWIHKFYNLFAKQNIVVEKTLNYDLEFINTTANNYLDGYWMSEKYFASIASIIRKEFVFRHQPDVYLHTLISQIRSTQSVSIHFRRGDYAANLQTNQYHGLCNFDYYDKAVTYISCQITNPFLFIFSDDIGWVKENWKINIPHIFVENPAYIHHSEDMRLMSLCTHNIIANSTYSWWAAWLNENEQKVVIAPSKWLNESSQNTKDIIPDRWIKI